MADWHSLHLSLDAGTAGTDAFVTGQLAPLLEEFISAGTAEEWFFIRYGEGGPHLRIRVRGLRSPALPGRLADRLAELAAKCPAESGPWPTPHGQVSAVPYLPETDRYGGPAALPIAERLFTVSTRTAVAALHQLAAGTTRLVLAADLAHATAHALGLDRLAAARWLRGQAAGWRWVTEVPLLAAAAVHSRVNSVYAQQRSSLLGRADALHGQLAEGSAAPWLADWVAEVRAADQELRALPDPDSSRLGWAWGSQLHMLFNRLGVSPDEERAVCRLAARTLLDSGEPPSFFPEGHRAPDRQYLERSKFQIGRNEDTALRPLAGTPPEPSPTELPLAARPLPETTLRTALATRRSARGPLTGPLDAATLGGLLWETLAESHRTDQPLAAGGLRRLAHRPYPSAGALYTARLRLVARSVDGLAPGTYEVYPERRTLRPIGPAPTLDELEALSTYFSRPATDPDRIGLEEAPALLGLYLDYGLLRERYGLRALRLGLLEAGHLAQNLLLGLAALGLATTPLGGFHDDLAHELLGLSDLDQPLQYLLPLGRTAPAGP
ncbi:Putative lantibiotic dehydrogenase domain [Kitasatospora sp. MMS16-BH015]|uniref:thiopeptide-type bacteriocin biosynthesis protein n=1 Tax=Kitasatospora sp. MMS16-BH015 TaxID=2018025 RepID=UPI000CA14B9A|nr:thiopeptide-type bacteriocin biosynthesis protein [Kitasatospora sp. MMS16-BH015]AUG81079.1 Putative lantibiotic dehydrogenase domain [Kitasatospora sp. MMS16-BH015]